MKWGVEIQAKAASFWKCSVSLVERNLVETAFSLLA